MEVNKDKGTSVGFSKGIIELIKEGREHEYKTGNFKISDVSEFKTPEMILVGALEEIIQIGKDWDWGEDFWAVKVAREALYEYSKKTF